MQIIQVVSDADRLPVKRKAVKPETPSHYHNVDWEMTDTEIAKLLGVTVQAVRKYRLNHGFPESSRKWQHADCKHPRRPRNTGRPRGAPARIDWANINWKLRNCTIARQYGYTADYVRKQRKKFATP